MSENETAIPYIAIIGGLYNLKENPEQVEEAKEYARQLGAELAKNSLGLVVYYSDEGSLEPHIVAGYVKALDDTNKSEVIRVRFGASQGNTVRFNEEAEYSNLFQRRVIGEEWEAPFYRSLVEANSVDGVLLMAGGRSTLIAGQVALGRGLPVLAVDCFDGSAKTIRSELGTKIKDYPSGTTMNAGQMISWLNNSCEMQATRLQEQEKYYQIGRRIISQSHAGLWTSSAATVFLVTLIYGLSSSPSPEIYPTLIFIGLVAAGATGALVRAVVWSERLNSNFISLLLGGVAGALVGLAYLIPQWIGAPGVLESSATIVETTDKIQFASAILVAVSAGVGFDTVFNRLMSEANNVPVTPSANVIS